jgi:DNA-directed RNA polymerase subunit E'/Rpb7
MNTCYFNRIRIKMFHTVYLDERVSMSPTEVNMIRSVDATKDILTTKLREKYEGKCNANGHVRPGSVDLLARSMGVAENGQFTGHYLFDCKVKCSVLYPTAGTVIDALVLKVNKMGAYAVFEEAIRILLPRDTHIGSAEFDAIKEGTTIKVRIDRSRFQTNDAFIMAVGSLVTEDAEAAPTPANAPRLETPV